jgi:hypothetical protein
MLLLMATAIMMACKPDRGACAKAENKRKKGKIEDQFFHVPRLLLIRELLRIEIGKPNSEMPIPVNIDKQPRDEPMLTIDLEEIAYLVTRIKQPCQHHHLHSLFISYI